MNIKGVNYTNGINYYNKVTSNKTNKVEKEKTYDRIEISEASKALKEYSINSTYNNEQRVMEVKNEISNGTYSYDARLIARGMLDAMRGKE
ncbi:flagellar biosynthesis anti-sigma factor FlgM [Clostridium sp. AL.422]|uniref:flagellar biosynthesis anti-sigma factor FlgM n=1 Tax=Clostridium TaxID=1485 RepID=UPI00293DD58E|nr:MULTISPECIES: flagellar biosynthesis anti-sigma factor FlgM [unclassified Clostridium]MDV4149728.1 flagellar biosynthesis anti-sigma factor FlgM [Clostridium sp. AL.422]